MYNDPIATRCHVLVGTQSYQTQYSFPSGSEISIIGQISIVVEREAASMNNERKATRSSFARFGRSGAIATMHAQTYTRERNRLENYR